MKNKTVIFSVILIFLTVAAKKTNTLKIEEVIYFQDTSVQLCKNGNKGYVLIINNFDEILESLVIFEDKNYTARQVYGELLLAYYQIKNAKKKTAEYEGEKYTIQLENLEGERKFLENLTDEEILSKYKSFCFIDQNISKDEKLTFIDDGNREHEDTIGSAAGFLMKIGASDFIDMLGEINK